MRRNKWFVLMLAGVTLVCGCGIARKPQDEEEWTLIEEKQAAALSDGTTVDRWRSAVGAADGTADIYKLPDGSELLLVYDPIGPDNVQVIGQESFQDLSETARRRVRLYYEEQGLLYDVQEELEKAYQEYLSCRQSNQTYFARAVRQEITPIASNDRLMSFITVLQLPLGDQKMQETRLSAIFDRETGEQLDFWSLFTAPRETVMERLLEAGMITDPSLYADMAAAFQTERIFFYPDHLEAEFPGEELPHADENLCIAIDYTDLSDILQSWAVPYSNP